MPEQKRIYPVETLWWDDSVSEVRNGKCAVYADQIVVWNERGERTKLAQLVHLIKPEMLHVRHIFQGLKRPCRVGNDTNADASKLIFVCSPNKDYEYSKVSCEVEQKSKPAGKVLAVIVSPIEGKHRAAWPEIDGWIEHWSWIEEAGDLQYAPVNHATRYDKKLWSRSK